MNIAVIGGGLAGLAAASELMRGGARVTIYEARAQAGGRMRSDELDGVVVDPTVQLVSSTYDSFFRLARDAGAADLLVRAPGRDALWRGGRSHEITYGSVTSMIGSSALPAGLKLKLGTRYLPFLGSNARSVDANDLAHTGGVALDGESIAAWGMREMGSDFVELLVYPLLAAYYGSPPEQTTAALYHALARVGMDVRVHAVRGGAGALPQAIAAALGASGATMRFSAPVDAIELANGGVHVSVAGARTSHDAVVVATAPAAARALLADAGAVRTWLEDVRVTPGFSVVFLLKQRLPGEWFGLSFPRTTEPGARIAAVALQSRKLRSLVPDGSEAAVVFPAPALAAELADAAPQACVDAVLPALEAAFPGFGTRVQRARVYPVPEGYALFYPGYLRHLRRFDALELPPRLALAGDYLVAPTVEGAVRSGRAAACRLLASDAGANR